MRRAMHSSGARTQVTIAVVLAVCALGLVAVNYFTTRANSTPHQLRAEKEVVRSVVEDLLVRHGVERGTIKTWTVGGRNGNGIRTEQRVVVPKEFISISFNHELSRLLAPYGARVVATERTKEQTVTMHIVSSGEVIHTLLLQSR